MDSSVKPSPGDFRHYNDLSLIPEEAWRLLADGATNRRAAAHTPVFASIGKDGRPNARVVVLRGRDPKTRILRVHTDQRSDKVRELEASAHAQMVVYDPAAKIQLRLNGDVSLHRNDEVRDQAWAGSGRSSRECYQVTLAPGTEIADPTEAVFDAGQTDDGANHFMVIHLSVTSFEWLYLAASGHRRARFTWDEEAWQAQWLVP